MKKFYLVAKDYQNESLNNLARRVAEYNTAELIKDGYEVLYTEQPPIEGQYQEIGKIAWQLPYTVLDIPVINDIFNYNLYFEKNNEYRLNVGNHFGTFDCLVSLAAGQSVVNNPKDIGLKGQHYVVDISPTAIHKTLGLYKEENFKHKQLDIFNIDAVKEFLSTCEGTKGFFVISNCFMYIINSLVYDVKLRLELQNKLINVLANDKIDWYIYMISADGTDYPCVRAKDITNKTLDKRFEVLPWIKA